MIEAHSRPAWEWPRAAYVHVPFCAHHCNYCDFAVVTGQDSKIDLYLDMLERELATLGSPQAVDTLFIGGGTPSHLDDRQWRRLLSALCDWLPLAPGAEFSVEANPNSVSEDKAALWAEGGVSRLSIGAQTFQPRLLAVLERDHSPEDIERTSDVAKRHFSKFSLDLIFAIPGQTQYEWDADLRTAMALRPNHVSTYGLTYEKGTPLWKDRQRGVVQAHDESSELKMYEAAIDVLGAAGFEHYEISNHAQPGCRARHNEVYWANHAYFGYGLGAARYVLGVREVNTRSFPEYLRRTLAGESPTVQAEKLDPRERARETMAVQLRRADGIERASFQAQTSMPLDDTAGERIRRNVERGLLLDNGEVVRLTRRGKYVADAVITDLLRQ
jgi:oxygen-independent coproporphyrinogen-3 oxidase